MMAPRSGLSPAGAGRQLPPLALASLLAILALFAVLGHEDRRVAQTLVLAAPMLAWLAWPVRHAGLARLRAVAAWLWIMAFVLDGSVRAYLLSAYQAAPESSFVLGAIANTGVREGSEYLVTQWRPLTLWTLLSVSAAVLVWRLIAQARPAPQARPSRWIMAGLALVVVIGAVGHASKPWRRLHPVAFWPDWGRSVAALRDNWADEQHERDEALRRALLDRPTVAWAGRSTVVMVISDSINRDNLSLYGYRRPTTPRLAALKEMEGERMLVLRNAWSADASTLPALRNMMGFGAPGRPDARHLLALARAAGYKTFWMSNHDDVAVDQQHARLADVVDLVNRTPGRSSASLDGELLDCLQEAMHDPAGRKFIVVHLQGAHPHYGLRFPAGFAPFDAAADAVEADLVRSGRSLWLRRFRQQYDAALLYHDFVVAEMLHTTRAEGRADDRRAFVYLSDHGQEVGHESDRAGHSPGTAAGYRIPAIVWRSEPFADATLISARPFRADWVAWTMADLLGLDWAARQPGANVLDPAYAWQPPVLPIAVRSFTD
jgi:heptose-I-phosphate ethanolaminephosphotransferase